VKIEEQHANGAVIKISGRRAIEHVLAWRKYQDQVQAATAAERETEPKMSGSHAYFSGEQDRDYDDPTWGKEAPVVMARQKIGFSI